MHIAQDAEGKDIPVNLEEFGLAASDAVPVYLSPSTGKVLVSWDALDARQRRWLTKKHGGKPEKVLRSFSIDAEGASRLDKDRLTWINKLGCKGQCGTNTRSKEPSLG